MCSFYFLPKTALNQTHKRTASLNPNISLGFSCGDLQKGAIHRITLQGANLDIRFYFLLHCRFPQLPTFLISTVILSNDCIVAFERRVYFGCWLHTALTKHAYLVGCMLPSCCRCCHCQQCSSWCCSHCGWNMSWAMCRPARVEWQSPQCLVNQACGQKKGGGKKTKRAPNG